MNTITEAELVDNARNGAVTCIKAVPGQNGKGFNLYANLTWKEGDLLLITQKKEPRNWTSADRLLAHIDRKYRKVDSLHIFLRNSEHVEQPPQESS